MQKTLPMYRLEEQQGRDIRLIIREAVARHGSVEAAARQEFGRSGQALRNWIELLDGHTQTQFTTEVVFDGWAPEEAAEQPQETVAA